MTTDFNSSFHQNVTGMFNVSTSTEKDQAAEQIAAVKQVFFNIQYFMLPFFLVTGISGNSITIATMLSSKFEHLTSRYILIFMALSDTMLLITQPFNKLWVIRLFGVDYRAISELSCKIFFVIFRSAKMTSSWLVVLLCYERFVAVVFPLQAKSIIRKRFMFPAIALDYLVMFTYNSVWHFSSGVVSGICKPDIPSFKHQVFVIIGCTFYSFIPTALLLIFTPQIIVRLLRHSRLRRHISTFSKQAANASARKEEETVRASVMVLGVMLAYIVLIIPITTVHMYAFSAGVSAFDVNSLGFFIYREIAQMLEQINYAVNFFFYVLCSGAFRQRVKELLCLDACFERQKEPRSERNRNKELGSELKHYNGLGRAGKLAEVSLRAGGGWKRHKERDCVKKDAEIITKNRRARRSVTNSQVASHRSGKQNESSQRAGKREAASR
ncbi:growth hormone secretagogue receptor type 1-like [Mya arenaria]|uniref:growth hormone secretagogue receptor type 1-like n=1 Tax=Mya arenaria TaxID=6604 RepID=UPI0022DECF05|nr:growth hormone secretagogue receptor type 1-like [Mya arenaria]